MHVDLNITTGFNNVCMLGENVSSPLLVVFSFFRWFDEKSVFVFEAEAGLTV